MATQREIENALSALIEAADKARQHWANQHQRYMSMLYGLTHPGSWEASEFKDDIARFVEAQEAREGEE